MRDESEVMAEAIGRYTLQVLGPYGVSAVRVEYDAPRRVATLDLGLSDTSFDAQTRVFEHVHELEDHYEDENIKLYMMPYDAKSPLFSAAPDRTERPRQAVRTLTSA